MDIKLGNEQIKQLSSALSINDVLDCIKNNSQSYLQFLNDELENKQITKTEYNKELILLEKLKELEVWQKLNYI